MKTFRLQLRFFLPLLVTLVAAAWLAAPIFDQLTLRWFSRDLTSRGVLVANALSDSVADAIVSERTSRLRSLFDRAVEDERLYAVGLCNAQGRLVEKSDRFPEKLTCP